MTTIDPEGIAHELHARLNKQVPLDTLQFIIDRFFIDLRRYISRPLTTKGGIYLQGFGTFMMYLDRVIAHRDNRFNVNLQGLDMTTSEFYDRLIDQLIYYNNNKYRKGKRVFYCEYIRDNPNLSPIERAGFESRQEIVGVYTEGKSKGRPKVKRAYVKERKTQEQDEFDGSHTRKYRREDLFTGDGTPNVDKKSKRTQDQ